MSNKPKLSSVFNHYVHKIKIGDLVVVSNLSLKNNYELKVPSHGYCVGIIVSKPQEPEVLSKKSLNIYYQRLYKVLICDKIVLIQTRDIKEKLT